MFPERARFTRGITIGARTEAAMYKISHISAIPLAQVAVITRAPAAEAPTHALIAECSLSTVTNSVSTNPSATNWENSCTTSV